jgi:hypothetical protein
MRFLSCCVLLAMMGGVAAQTSSSRASFGQTAAWKHYCQPNGGFCFRYPSSWIVLGEIFAGHGVVIAPQQTGNRELWNAVTVAMVVPPPDNNEEPLGLDGVIKEATSGLREQGQDFETVQRQQRTVDHKPAELLKVRYQDKKTGREWIEEMVFVEGPDNEIYSVALKSSPQDVSKLEASFNQLLASWTLPEPEPPPGATEKTPPQPKPAAPVKPQ